MKGLLSPFQHIVRLYREQWSPKGWNETW